MTWDGFIYPTPSCKNCGKTLGTQQQGNPAESYLGTYTGLCYGCERIGKTLIWEYLLDGAKRYSYPPNSPSHRRDRETYVAYEDCEKCKGNGFTMVSRSLSQGGSYRSYCDVCSKRFHSHPRRVEAGEFHTAEYKSIKEKFNDAFIAQLKIEVEGIEFTPPMGRNGQPLKRIPKGWKPQSYKDFGKDDPRHEQINAIGKIHLAHYDEAKKILDQKWEELFPDVAQDAYHGGHPLG